MDLKSARAIRLFVILKKLTLIQLNTSDLTPFGIGHVLIKEEILVRSFLKAFRMEWGSFTVVST